ncbi:MAG: response regulator [Oligoflexia bacterium]|nr:response regulator [Oligoflexia bacterium]
MKYKILIVDDENDIIFLLTELLKKNFSCDISAETNGTEAFITSLEEEFDLIITDYLMSETTGSEFINELRENKWVNHLTPVVLFTGYIEEAKLNLSCFDNVFFVDKTKYQDELVPTVQMIFNFYAKKAFASA